MKTWTMAAVAVLAAAEATAAPSVVVSASLSETRAAVGDVVTLDVRAVSTQNADLSIQLPPLDGLTVVGRSESTQMSMSFTSAGQQIRREKLLQVELSVDKPGRLTIPPVVARAGGSSGQSAPVVLEVGGSAPANPVRPEDGAVISPTGGEGDLFVRYRLSRGSVWLGQQVLLDLEIFARPGFSFQVETVSEPPELDGFWQEVLERPQRLVPRNETVDGVRYQVFRAWRLALFPLQAGARTIEPTSVGFRVGGSGLFSTGRRMQRQALPLELEVRALPEAGRPAGFSPAHVGTYALNATVDGTKLETGQAVVLKIGLSGEGQIKGAKLPSLGRVEGFRVFPPTESVDVELRPNGVHGTRMAEVLLVPEQPGQFELPSLELPIFEPYQGRYRVLKTAPIPLEVKGEPKPSTEPDPDPEPKPSVAAPVRRPIRLTGGMERPPSPPWRSPLWWLVLGAGPILWGGAVANRRVAAAVTARGNDPRRERLAEARTAEAKFRSVATLEPAEAAAAFLEAFHARASVQLKAPTKSLTAEELSARLRAAGADPAFAETVERALETAQYARYAGGGQFDAEQAGSLLDGLEKIGRRK